MIYCSVPWQLGEITWQIQKPTTEQSLYTHLRSATHTFTHTFTHSCWPPTLSYLNLSILYDSPSEALPSSQQKHICEVAQESDKTKQVFTITVTFYFPIDLKSTILTRSAWGRRSEDENITSHGKRPLARILPQGEQPGSRLHLMRASLPKWRTEDADSCGGRGFMGKRRWKTQSCQLDGELAAGVILLEPRLQKSTSRLPSCTRALQNTWPRRGGWRSRAVCRAWHM